MPTETPTGPNDGPSHGSCDYCSGTLRNGACLYVKCPSKRLQRREEQPTKQAHEEHQSSGDEPPGELCVKRSRAVAHADINAYDLCGEHRGKESWKTGESV